MKNFDIQCNNLRIRGIYDCQSGMSHEEVSGIILRHAGNLLSGGVSESALCREKLAESLVCENVVLRTDDISPLVAVHVEWTCSCGHINRGKFCTRCGLKRSDGSLYCSACGRKSAPDDNFCAGCGKKLR